MENYTLTNLRLTGGDYLLTSCNLSTTDDCMVSASYIISGIIFVVDIFDGKKNSPVEINSGIPRLYRGEAWEHAGIGLSRYSTFESQRSVANINSTHPAYIHLNTDCLENSKGKLDMSYNSSLGTCKSLSVNFNVLDAKNQLNFSFSGNITQGSANNQAYFNISSNAEYQKPNLNESKYDFNGCTEKQLAYSNQPNLCFRQFTSADINATSPIFWSLGFFILDLKTNGTYETSGALPLIILCNGPNNTCS
uniref:Uncharacterized protein n=1 Tax=Acrobeloides nanus TaxID=290746 RepID=A0A914DC80_9BILA